MRFRLLVVALSWCLAVQPALAEPSEGEVYAVNMVLSGLFAAFSARHHARPPGHRGRSFWRGFLGGALGGAISCAAKEQLGGHDSADDVYLGEHFLGDVGASVVENAGHGQELFRTVRLTYGPAMIHLRPEGTRVTPMYLHMAAFLATAADKGGDVDWNDSFRTGVFVIRNVPANYTYWGRAHLGTLMTTEDLANAPLTLGRVTNHELVHTLQERQFMAFSSCLPLLPHRDGRDYVTDPRQPLWQYELGAVGLQYALGGGWLDYDDRPTEIEAKLFEGN